jgi:hypothetical protein
MEELTTKRHSAALTVGIILLTLLVCLFGNVQEVSAADSDRPSTVTVAHVTDGLFCISWITDSDSTGYVMYGTSPSNLNMTALDDRGASIVDDTHHVRIGDWYDTEDSYSATTPEPALEPGTTYHFRIISNGIAYGVTDGVADEGEAPWTVTTSHEPGVSDSHIVFGGVYDTGTENFASGALTFVTITDNSLNISSAPLSTLTSENGLFGFNLSDARHENGSAFQWRHGQTLTFFVHAGDHGTGFNETPLFRWSADWNLQGFERVDLQDNSPPAVDVVFPGAEGGVANDTFTVKWTDSDIDDDALVSIYYDMDDSPGNEVLVKEAVSEGNESDSLTFTTTQIPTASQFYVKIEIFDGFNPLVYDYSPPIVIDRTPPSAVIDLTAQPGTNNGDVRLSWTAPGDDGLLGNATYYTIRYSTDPLNPATWDDAVIAHNNMVPGGPGTPENFTIAGLTPGLLYYFGIRTSDGASLSSLSNIATSYPEIDLGPPSDIADLRAVEGVETGEVLLQWTAPGDDGDSGSAARYIIRYNTTGLSTANWDTSVDVTNQVVPRESGLSESFTVTGLVPEARYYFAVMAVDEADNPSQMSNVATAEARLDTTAPRAITDLSAMAGTNNGEVVLYWTAPGDDGSSGNISGYELRYLDFELTDANWDSATVHVDVIPVGISGTHQNYTVTDLVSGQMYHFALKAVDERPNHSPISNSPQAMAYSDATFVIIDSPREGQVFLTTDVISFDAFNSTDADDNLTFFWTSSIDGGLFGEARTLTNLSEGEHRIELHIVNEKGQSVSNTVNITVIPARVIEPHGPGKGPLDDIPLSIPCLFSLALLMAVFLVVAYDFKQFVRLRKVRSNQVEEKG